MCTAATSPRTIPSKSSKLILFVKESLSQAIGLTLIASDFNSKSADREKACLDRRGILIGEMVARNDLTVLKRGREMTFRRGAKGSIIDLTIAAPRLA